MPPVADPSRLNLCCPPCGQLCSGNTRRCEIEHDHAPAMRINELCDRQMVWVRPISVERFSRIEPHIEGPMKTVFQTRRIRRGAPLNVDDAGNGPKVVVDDRIDGRCPLLGQKFPLHKHNVNDSGHAKSPSSLGRQPELGATSGGAWGISQLRHRAVTLPTKFPGRHRRRHRSGHRRPRTGRHAPAIQFTPPR
jgi:hypothetical protein